ncbi:hypothetical protein [Streptomyces cavernae]|uniref:hypothetical protein n=1 Tax=Streptomyces cavernae TaxID=2259034 RepID=UPI000FEBC4FB|nr:hypothetical protein [Streptomyces cavernae]
MSHGRSLVNVLQQTNTKTATVKVGDGVTFLRWSDRSPGTVAEVQTFKSGPKAGTPRRIGVRADNYKIVSGSQQGGSARYEITQDPEARVFWYRLTKKGWKREGGSTFLHVGTREVWCDPTF